MRTRSHYLLRWPGEWLRKDGAAARHHLSLGPGPAKVHLKVKSNWKTEPIYDVIGKIQGATFPDEWVIRGNHHDGWVNGAEDPISGQLPSWKKRGLSVSWLSPAGSPKRTQHFIARGTEKSPDCWARPNGPSSTMTNCAAHGVAYINSDANGRGYLGIEGVAHARKIQQRYRARNIRPGNKAHGLEAQHSGNFQSQNAEPTREIRKRVDLRISRPGPGSDYTAFSSTTAWLSSISDSAGKMTAASTTPFTILHWYTHSSDTDFVYGRALAPTGGTA